MNHHRGGALIVPEAECLTLARSQFWQFKSANAVALLLFAFVLTRVGAFALSFGMHLFRVASFAHFLFTIIILQPGLSETILILSCVSY